MILLFEAFTSQFRSNGYQITPENGEKLKVILKGILDKIYGTDIYRFHINRLKDIRISDHSIFNGFEQKEDGEWYIREVNVMSEDDKNNTNYNFQEFVEYKIDDYNPADISFLIDELMKDPKIVTLVIKDTMNSMNENKIVKTFELFQSNREYIKIYEEFKNDIIYKFMDPKWFMKLLQMNNYPPNKPTIGEDLGITDKEFKSKIKTDKYDHLLDKYFISFTRNKDLKMFENVGKHIRISFNKNKLKHNYKIIPIEFFRTIYPKDKDDFLQYEERLIFNNKNGINNWEKYVLRIDISKKMDKKLKQKITNELKGKLEIGEF